MEMAMQMESNLKDSNVGVGVGVGVVVGGVVTPTDTANYELAAKALLKLPIAALIFKAAYQFMEAKDSWEMNKTDRTEEAVATRYYCYRCHHVVTVDVVNEVDKQHHEATSPEWILLLTSLGLEILSAAFDQVSSPHKPHCALIGMLLAIVAILACIWEVVHNGTKERVVLRRRGKLWCFYYPPPNNMLFGTFPEFFGLGLAIVQCICSAVQYYYLHRHATNPIKLSPVPVVFFFGLVVLKLVKNQKYTVDDTLLYGT